MKIQQVKFRNCPVCNNDSGVIKNNVDKIDLFKCSNCSMVFADVGKGDIAKINIYEPGALELHYFYEPIYTLVYYDMLVNKLQKKFRNKSIRVLDFGCGAGMFMRRARKKCVEIYGSDHSPYAKVAAETFDLKIECCDINESKYKDEYFDVIISHATFEHLSEPFQIAKTLYRKLKPSGLFIIAGVPNYNTLTIQLFNDFWNNKPPKHCNFFEIKSMNYFYNKLGFQRCKYSTYGFNIWKLFFPIQKIRHSKQKKEGKIKANCSSKMYDYENIEPKLHHYVIAKIYSLFRISGMGQCINAWGFKSKA